MNKTPFPTVWVFPDMEGLRSSGNYATYGFFEAAKFPSPSYNFDGFYGWLASSQDHNPHSEESYLELLPDLDEEAKEIGLKIPDAFKHFIFSENLPKKVRSCTDCYFEMGDFIEEIPGGNGLYALHFMSDSQDCGFWYLCMDRDGGHCIVFTQALLGHDDDRMLDLGDDVPVYWVAPDIETFLYYWWIENEIWFRKYRDRESLKGILKKYAEELLRLNSPI